MSLRTPDVGEVEMLKRILNASSTGNVVLKLFTNDYTPTEDSILGSFTECSSAGYADKTLSGASWTIQTTGGVSRATYAEQSFDLTAAAAVYGYYVTNTAEDTLLWAERFASVLNIPADGGSIQVTPRFELD